MNRAAGAVFIIASVTFLLGATISVPTVFATSDTERRWQLLQRHRRRWQWSQPLFAGGPIGTAAGAVVLAGRAGDSDVRRTSYAAAAALAIGAVAWAYACGQRSIRVEDFAFHRLPAWPFQLFFGATVLGIGLLGVAVLLAGLQPWLGVLMLVVGAGAAAAYLTFGDLPPFVFYLLFLTVGIAAVRQPID